MKKILLFFALAALLVACGTDTPEKPLSHDDRPTWTPQLPEKTQVNMTGVLCLSMASTANDLLMAEVDGTCRALATRSVEVEDVWYITIPGTAEENGTITFRFYSEEKQHIYTSQQTATFSANSSLGSVDQPMLLTLLP